MSRDSSVVLSKETLFLDLISDLNRSGKSVVLDFSPSKTGSASQARISIKTDGEATPVFSISIAGKSDKLFLAMARQALKDAVDTA